MTLSDYAKLKTSLDKADEDLGLSTLERDTLTSFYRVELRGKRHNRVPIMMKEDIKKCLDLLIKTREEAEVSGENKYVFSLSKVSRKMWTRETYSRWELFYVSQGRCIRGTLYVLCVTGPFCYRVSVP